MDRPSCGNCLHFTPPTGDGKGECHGVQPTVVALNDQVRTLWPEVSATTVACLNHKNIEGWGSLRLANPAPGYVLDRDGRSVASGIRGDGQRHLKPEEVRQRFPCHCVRLGPNPDKPRLRVRLSIEGDSRVITALKTCPACGGSGKPDSPTLAGMPSPTRPRPKITRGPMAWEGGASNAPTEDEDLDNLDRVDAELLEVEEEADDNLEVREPFDLTPLTAEQMDSMDPAEIAEIRRLRSGWRRRQQPANPM